jgi:hypothetical protein
LIAIILQASTLILDMEVIKKLKMERYGLMEPLLPKETPYQLVTQLDARLLQLLMDGMFLQLPLKFLVQMLPTKKLNLSQPVIPLDAKRHLL